MVAETVWDTPERQKYLSETIVEHLYRQGMLSVAEDLCQVSNWCCVIDCGSQTSVSDNTRITLFLYDMFDFHRTDITLLGSRLFQ